MDRNQLEIHLSNLVEEYQGNLQFVLEILGGQAGQEYKKSMSPEDVVNLILQDLGDMGELQQIKEDLDRPEIREMDLWGLLERYPHPEHLR
jgi:hypothetical protein